MNILLVNTDKAKLYPLKFKEYIESKGAVCYISGWRVEDLIPFIERNNITPLNTLIHARTAGPHVTETYKRLEGSGFRIINKSSTTALTSNKYESQIYAQKHDIPIGQTFKVNKGAIDQISRLADEYGSVIAKPIYSQGRGIYCKKIDHNTAVDRIVTLIADIPGEEIIIQEYIRYQKLIRTIVIDGKMLATATTFDVPNKDWKASVCMNPNIQRFVEHNQKLVGLAEKTAKAFEAEVSFIDFFQSIDGDFILNELNTACGLIIHEDVTGVKIHQNISDYLLSRLNL